MGGDVQRKGVYFLAEPPLRRSLDGREGVTAEVILASTALPASETQPTLLIQAQVYRFKLKKVGLRSRAY